MRIAIRFSDNDLQYFRNCLHKVKDGKLASNEKAVLAATRQLMTEVAANSAPRFVKERFEKLGEMLQMLEDERWRLTEPDRKRMLNALAYFVDPDDLIPDRIPGLGFLDDAIMVALVIEEFRHVLDAYEKFCEFEGTPAATEKKRLALQKRMRSQRKSEIERRRLIKRGGRGPFGLW
jgi:uncharacterized membrane protein YkvA (DUF1232 family)